MKKHKLDIYVDGSLAKDNTNGIGAYVLFDGVPRFQLGKKLSKKVPHAEVVELFAVEDILRNLNGGSKTRKVSNSEITIYIDSSTVVNYFNKGTSFKNIPKSTKTNCKGYINSLTKDPFNNIVNLEKIERSENKAHDLAYNAAVNGKNVSLGDISDIIEETMTTEDVLSDSPKIVIPNKDTTLLDIAKTLIAEQEKLTLMETQVSNLSKDNKELQSQIIQTETSKNIELRAFMEKNKELLSELEKANALITSLSKDNSALKSQLDLANQLNTDTISSMKSELDMYKRKVLKLETQRKSRLMREKVSKSLSHPDIPAYNIRTDLDAEIACSIEDYEPINVNSNISIVPSKPKPILSRLLKKVSR